MSRTGRTAVYDAPNTPFVIRHYPLRNNSIFLTKSDGRPYPDFALNL